MIETVGAEKRILPYADLAGAAQRFFMPAGGPLPLENLIGLYQTGGISARDVQVLRAVRRLRFVSRHQLRRLVLTNLPESARRKIWARLESLHLVRAFGFELASGQIPGHRIYALGPAGAALLGRIDEEPPVAPRDAARLSVAPVSRIAATLVANELYTRLATSEAGAEIMAWRTTGLDSGVPVSAGTGGPTATATALAHFRGGLSWIVEVVRPSAAGSIMDWAAHRWRHLAEVAAATVRPVILVAPNTDAARQVWAATSDARGRHVLTDEQLFYSPLMTHLTFDALGNWRERRTEWRLLV